MRLFTNAVFALACSLAAPAIAAAADTPAAALVRHLPPSEAVAGAELRLVAVIDDAWVESGLVARYRWIGSEEAYETAPFRRSSAGGYYAVIPAEAVRRPGLAYYIEGTGAARPHFASPRDPHVVRVERDRDKAWVEQELHRLGDRRYSVRVDTHAQDFGGDAGADRLFRGEIDWTYKLVSPLYAINLGFGAVEARTPLDAAGTETERRGYRYGYGGMRFRLRDSVWVDGRAIIGMSDDGFSPGGGGQLILGDDWRTCVKIGGELSEALSYRAWITLQWDTVPGFLMSATAATTDEPRAEIDTGAYVLYEVRYPLSPGFAVSGKLSYGARGNRPGGIGGGLGTELSF